MSTLSSTDVNPFYTNTEMHLEITIRIPLLLDRIRLDGTANHVSLPLIRFRALLSPLSRFFSSFPQGTFTLSVSCQYLALVGLYQQFRAEFPNNSTLWEHITKHWQSMSDTGLSPSVTLHSRRLVHGPVQITLL